MNVRSFALLALLACSMPALQAKTWNVGILVYNGVFDTEFVAPIDVFQHVHHPPETEVHVFLVAPSAGPVVSAEGLKFRPDYTLDSHPPIDILIIPSFQTYQDDLAGREKIIRWVAGVGAGARWVLSNCWGAFYLAKAGLLDGRYAMTYPPDIDRLARQFPAVKAIKGYRFVRDGKFVTSGGGVASYENALYVVEQIWGKPLARGIASGLVLDWNLEKVRHYVARH